MPERNYRWLSWKHKGKEGLRHAVKGNDTTTLCAVQVPPSAKPAFQVFDTPLIAKNLQVLCCNECINSYTKIQRK